MCKNNKLAIGALKNWSASILSCLVIGLVFIVLLYVRHVLVVMAEKETYYYTLYHDAEKVISDYCEKDDISPDERAKRENSITCVEKRACIKMSPRFRAFEETLSTEFHDHIPFLPWCIESGWCMGYVVYQMVDLVKIAWWAFISQATLLLFIGYMIYKYLYPNLKHVAASLKNLESHYVETLPTKNE